LSPYRRQKSMNRSSARRPDQFIAANHYCVCVSVSCRPCQWK
jgi:hypothetical protein